MKKIILMLLFSISVNAQLLTLMSDEVTDTIPSAFSFTDATLAYSYTEYTSDSIIVAGLSDSATISISGDGYFKIGSAGTFTQALDYVSNGDTVWLVDTTNATGLTDSTTLTIGGVSDLWTVNCPLQSVILNGVDERAYYVGDISSDISLDSTTSLIIEFSFWANTTSGSRMIMYIGDSRIWHYNGGGLRWYVSNNQNSSFFSYTSVLEDSTWYDIVLTFNLSMSHPTITVNGASNYIGSGTNNLTTPTWNDITIGEYGAGGFNFGGEIGKITITYGDHITIYDWSGSDITTRLQDKGGNSFNLNSDGIE